MSFQISINFVKIDVIEVIPIKKYILSIDQGTTSSRAILFDKTGNIVSSSQKEIKMIYQKEDYVEQNAKEIWTSVLTTTAECLHKAEVVQIGRAHV